MEAEGSRENVRPALWAVLRDQQSGCWLGQLGEAVTQAELARFSDEGRAGGNLLTALLSLGSEYSEAAKPVFLTAEQDPDHTNCSYF